MIEQMEQTRSARFRYLKISGIQISEYLKFGFV